MRMFLWRLLTIILFAIVVPQTVFASQIKEFNADIVLHKDGSAKITEKIFYDLGSSPVHGILRDIPTVKTNSNNQKFQLSITDITVVNDKGVPYRFSTSNTSGVISIKIGDPNIFLKGPQFFKISYQLKGGITYFSDHDEFYWNVTGNAWEDGITSSVVNVILPEKIPAQNVKFDCFTGILGSNEAACVSSYYAGVYKFSLRRTLNPKEGFTILAGFPKQIVSVVDPMPISVATPRASLSDSSAEMLQIPEWIQVLIVFWFIVFPFLYVIKWKLFGKDPKVPMGIASASFSVPKSALSKREYPPAVCGTILNGSAGMPEITATIVDLARRGYLKIFEKKKGEFYFEKLNRENTNMKDPGLLPFEEKLLNVIFTPSYINTEDSQSNTTIEINGKTVFDGKSSELNLDHLDKAISTINFKMVNVDELEIADKLENIYDMIHAMCIDEKIYEKPIDASRSSKSFLSFLAFLTVNIPLLVVILTIQNAKPKKTEYGVVTKNMIIALKQFLKSQDRQFEFMSEKQFMFEKLLPYAIAFGVEKIWLARFKELELKVPSWYTSYDQTQGFVFTRFHHAVSKTFTHSPSNSNTYYTPTRTSSTRGFSSGFSSHSSGGRRGGYSGGGGGGGGGGKW